MTDETEGRPLAANENEPFEDERPPYKVGVDELVLEIEGYEADDIIATYCELSQKEKNVLDIVTLQCLC